MLTIRLSRFGKKKHPVFRIIISEKSKDTVGDYLELLGSYDPHTNKVDLKTDRVQYWLSKGASTSGVVHNLLIDQKLITGEKIKVANIRKKEEVKPTTETPQPKAAPTPAQKAEEPKAEAAAPAPAPKVETVAPTPAPTVEAPQPKAGPRPPASPQEAGAAPQAEKAEAATSIPTPKAETPQAKKTEETKPAA